MNETTFTRQFMQNWQRQHPELLWWHKIADPTYGGNVTHSRAVDVIACFKGVCVGLEWKLKKDDRAFPLDKVRDGQICTLLDIEKAGGVGFVMIAVYKGSRDKHVYMIPIKQWIEITSQIKTRKSVRLELAFARWRVEIDYSSSHANWNASKIEKRANEARLKNFYQ